MSNGKVLRAKGEVVSVSASKRHGFSKDLQHQVRLLAGLGVEGDAHMGETVKHRSRVAVDPTQPNLRQVHLLHEELFDELAEKGFNVSPGELGENIVTRGLDLLALPRGTVIALGADAEVEVTGLRNPCKQIDDFRTGLLAAVVDRNSDGTLVRKAGIMGIVRSGGYVQAGDGIKITLPAEPWVTLDRV